MSRVFSGSSEDDLVSVGLQVQMLLEAQGKLQSSSQQVETRTPRSTASIAVGTGETVMWYRDRHCQENMTVRPRPGF